ncbi:MAG: 30S ribosomal protein S1, partial [Dehalococcoidia bacterium]|nr:30S ribosomal protein S1 [Dehalococcoidia bacterium]
MSTDTAQPNPSSAADIDMEMDMGALLDSEAGQPGQLRRGEIVEGMVMGASADGLIVDVGTKTEAVIPQG